MQEVELRNCYEEVLKKIKCLDMLTVLIEKLECIEGVHFQI